MVAEFPALFQCQPHAFFVCDPDLNDNDGLPWPDHLGGSEEGAKHKAKASDYDVSNTKERVPTAHHRPGRDQDRLGPIVY